MPVNESKDRRDLIQQLQASVMAADLHYRVWWIYKNKDDREKYLDVLNDYLGFFRVSIQAHFIAVTVILYAIYEERSDTVNLSRLFASAGRDLQATIAEKYTRARAIWTKVAIIRNNHVGHVNDRLDVDEVFQKANVTYNDIRDLIQLSKELVNAFSYAEDRSTFAYNLDSAGDTYRVLDDLRRELMVRRNPSGKP